METWRQDICLELLELLVYLSPSLFYFVYDGDKESKGDECSWREDKQQNVECLGQQG